METERIPRASVNSGFDFEEAILEAIDDSIEAAGKPTEIDCWVLDGGRSYSYIVADKAGGTNLEEVFTISSEKNYSERFANVNEIYERTGMFGAGSLSHLNVSNKVYFLTRNDKEWEVLILEKVLETGDFRKKYRTLDQIDSSISLTLKSKIDIDQYDSILFVTGVNKSTNQTVNDFKEKKNFHGLEKNLRSTYVEKLLKGYIISLNGVKIKPLDVFYSDCIDKGRLELLKIELTLYDLLENNSYYKEEIYERYLEVYKKDFQEQAEQRLLQEKIVISFYAYDSKYFNNNYFKTIMPNDRVKFNLQSSGAWIHRNGRKVGNPSLLSFTNNIHPDWNGFRARIDFNPIFDVYFGIQVNKNRYFISDAVNELIRMKVNEKYGSNAVAEIRKIIKSCKYTQTTLEQLTLDIGNEDKPLTELHKKAEEVGFIELERLGFTVKDETKSNKGYDFEAKNTLTGEVRYVDVKRISKIGDAFTLTRKQYKTSLSMGDKYFFCLVLLKENSNSFIWIKNPHKVLSFEAETKVISYKVAKYSSDDEYNIEQQ